MLPGSVLIFLSFADHFDCDSIASSEYKMQRKRRLMILKNARDLFSVD